MEEYAGEITIRLGSEIDRVVSLASDVVTIGRAPDADITLQHPVVSRQHAELRAEPVGVTLTDVGSSNGTFIDEVRLSPNQPHLLSSGTSFRIGPYFLTYRSGTDEELEDQNLAGEPDAVEPVPIREKPVEPFVSSPPPAPPRPSYDAPAPPGPYSIYMSSLPDLFQENDFLGRFMLIFESLWEPLEQRQDHIHAYFDPHTAPRSFLPWLAGWLDLSLDPHWPESRSRALLADAMDLYRWRGTRYGLSRLIEVSTGSSAEVIDDPDRPFVFDVRVTVPAGNEVSDELIRKLIQTHKPAHTGYVLEVVRQ